MKNERSYLPFYDIATLPTSTTLPTPFRLSNFPARAGSNWPFWGSWAEDIEIAWKVEACWPTAREELFQKDCLLLALYTTIETSQHPKPTGLARKAEIWRFQSSCVPKLDCWKMLGVPNWCPLWNIWPRKMYILMPQEVGLQNKGWTGAKKQAPFARVEMKFDSLLHRVSF